MRIEVLRRERNLSVPPVPRRQVIHILVELDQAIGMRRGLMYTILSDALPRNAAGEYEHPPRAHALDFPGRLEFVRNPELARTAQSLTFYVDQSRPLPDFLAVDNVIGGKLCSSRFIDVLAHESVEYIAYPAQLAASDSGETISIPHASYYLWTLRRIPNVVDWKRSQI
jgi:hypothetical protein